MKSDISALLAAIGERLEAIQRIASNYERCINDAEHREREARQRDAEAIAEQARLAHATERKRSADNKKSLCVQWVIGSGTWAAVIAACIYAAIAAHQLTEMRNAAGAATSSATTAKETMISSQRPWVGDEGGVEVKVEIVNTDTVSGNMKFLAKNFGPSPALDVGVGAFPFIRRTGENDSDFTQARKQACAWADTNALILGDSLFPEQMKKYDAIVLSPVEGIEKRDRMLFAGCIAYRDQFDTTRTTHHTSFCVMGAIKHLESLYNCGTGEIAN